jgi:hypothetical protein
MSERIIPPNEGALSTGSSSADRIIPSGTGATTDLGGASLNIYTPVIQGGVVFSGLPIVGATPYSSSGGPVLSSASTITYLKGYDGYGTITVSGSSLVATIKEYSCSGSCLISGNPTFSATNKPVQIPSISGGIISSGNPEIVKVLTGIPSGGLLFSGDGSPWGTNQAIRNYSSTGGLVLSGEAVSLNPDIYIYLPSGGCVFGGPSEVDYPAYLSLDGSSYLYKDVEGTYSVLGTYLVADNIGYFLYTDPIPSGDQWLYNFNLPAQNPTKFTFATKVSCGDLSLFNKEPNFEGVLFEIGNYTEVNESGFFTLYCESSVLKVKHGYYIGGTYYSYNYAYTTPLFNISNYTSLRRVVLHYDSSQVAQEDRIKLYVDGTLQSSSSPSYPPQNTYAYNNEVDVNLDLPVGLILGTRQSGTTQDYPGGCVGVGSAFIYKDTIFLDGYIVSDALLYPNQTGCYAPSNPFGYGGVLLRYEDSTDVGFNSINPDVSFGNYGECVSFVDETYSSGINTTKFTFFTKLFAPTVTTHPNYVVLEIASRNYHRLKQPTYFKIGVYQDTYKVFVHYVVDGVFLIDLVSTASFVFTPEVFTSLCVQVDTQQSTAANRLKVFIEDTLVSWDPSGTLPTQGVNIYGSSGIDSPRFYIGKSFVPVIEGIEDTYASFVGKLSSTLYVDGFIFDVTTLSSTFSGPYGPYGWDLRYGDTSLPGLDSSPNSLNFLEYLTNTVELEYETTSSFGKAICFSLERGVIPIQDILLGFTLVSSQSVIPTITFSLLVDPYSISLPLKLFGGGEEISIEIVFCLTNIAYQSNEMFVSWSAQCLLGGDDYSSLLVEEVSIEYEEDSSTIAQFIIAPKVGVIDPLSFIGKEVQLIWRKHTSSGEILFSDRRFYGLVSDIAWDADTRLLAITADTQLPAYFNGLSKEEITDQIGGMWSDRVWDDDDDSTGWTYAQERLSTTEDSVWQDKNWSLRLTDIKAKDNPDFVFTDSHRFNESLSVEYSQRSEMVNEIRVLLQFAYQRKRQRRIRFSWDTYGGIGDFACGNSYQLCQRSLIESAASSGSWVAVSKISYTPLWEPQIVSCGGGMYDITVWGWSVSNIYTPDPNDPTKVAVNVDNGQVVNNTKLDYQTPVSSSIANSLCIGARWLAGRRWLQDVSEYYTIYVRCQDSIDSMGRIPSSEEYAIDSNIDNRGWEDSLVPFEPMSFSGGLSMDGSGDTYWNSDEDADWGTTEEITAKVGGDVSLEYTDIDNVVVTNNSGSIVYQFSDTKGDILSKNGWFDKASGTIYVFTEATQSSKSASHIIVNDQTLQISYDYANGMVVNRSKFNQAQEVILAATKGDILRSHRLTTVSFKVAYNPSVDLSHTVQISTPRLSAKGKVRYLKDLWSLSTGEASTEIGLAISRHNGSGLYTPDPLSPIDRPDPTEEEEIDDYIKLHNYIGGRSVSVGFSGEWFDNRSSGTYDEISGTWDEEPWQGFLTNYESPMSRAEWSAYWSQPEYMAYAAAASLATVSGTIIPYQFIVRGPDIEEAHTNSVVIATDSSFNVTVPNDLLVITA